MQDPETAALDLPQPLKIELIQDKPGAPPEDKVADWASAVHQLRTIAQWVIGGVIAAIVAIFATSAFARLGVMDPGEDAVRLGAAAAGFVLAIVAIATIFRFGVRVIVPAGTSLARLAAATDGSSDARARDFLYDLHDADPAIYSLKLMLEQPDDPASRHFLPKFRRVLGFAVAKTRFDELVKALYLSLPFAIAGLLLFTWAANPPEPEAVPRGTEEVRITTSSDGGWERSVTTTTTRKPTALPTVAPPRD